MRLSYIIPTRNRPGVLARTLDALGSLPPHDAEVIVIDNASDTPPCVARALANGLPTRLIRRDENIAAAARNEAAAASDPSTAWLVMLDDDSYPLGLGHLDALRAADPATLAVAAEIFLTPTPAPPREAGGLPEVFIGCGVAVRRGAFLAAGGYDAAFDYYAEEYDLAAKLMLLTADTATRSPASPHSPPTVAFDRRFRVVHEKTAAGRDMGRILARLVRNNGWVAARYAPDRERAAELDETIARYRAIALKENVLAGYDRGLTELRSTLHTQPRRPMPTAMFERFTGLAAARDALARAYEDRPFATYTLAEHGKNAGHIRRAAADLGLREVGADTPDTASPGSTLNTNADALIIGTLSPGPMLDALHRLSAAHPTSRIIPPWTTAWPAPHEHSRPHSEQSRARKEAGRTP